MYPHDPDMDSFYTTFRCLKTDVAIILHQMISCLVSLAIVSNLADCSNAHGNHFFYAGHMTCGP